MWCINAARRLRRVKKLAREAQSVSKTKKRGLGRSPSAGMVSTINLRYDNKSETFFQLVTIQNAI